MLASSSSSLTRPAGGRANPRSSSSIARPRCSPSSLSIARAQRQSPIARAASTTTITPQFPAIALTTSRRAAAAAAPPQPQRLRSSSSSSLAATASSSSSSPPEGSVSVVLLSGGSGKRMGAPIPKQYLELRGQAIATHSMATFARMPQVGEIVVVCDPAWKKIFEPVALAELTPRGKRISYALPGAERQDSVASGLAQVSTEATIVAVHDSARPLVTADDAARCIQDAFECGAAVLGVPCKQTVKEVDSKTGLVARTLDRSLLWEVQTPQCVRPDLLRRGFEHVAENNLAVTDDVSVVEALGEPVRITRGCYTNIKVTTPEDMGVAEGFIDEREAREKAAKGGKVAAAAA